MPKELIQSHMSYCEPRTAEDPTPHIGMGVEVSWGRDAEYVQVASGAVPETGFDSASAMFVHLNRAGINRLIQTLRRARDQAYGRDA